MSDWQPTTCMRCAVGCGHLQKPAADGTLAAVKGHAGHPTTDGSKCKRGIDETVDPKGERITEPLIRRGGELRPATWDTALGLVTSRFIEALGNNDGDIAVLGSGQQTNEAAYALGKLARGGFGTPYYDSNTTLCMASAVSAYFKAFGSDAPPPTYEDIPDAETHLIWGANPATAHPVVYRWITESIADGDGQLLVVDPVETTTAADADTHIQPTAGTDLALARAVLAAVIDAGDVATEFIETHTTGYEELVNSLPELETAAETAGVSPATVQRIADALTDQTLLYWGMGVNQSVQGTATARALIDLCLATGNMGPGSGPFSLTGQANSMGNRVCSSKNTWPGHRPFTETTARKAVAAAWDVPLSRLPETPGPGFVGIVDALARGDIEVCWTVATNPAAGMPDAGQVKNVLNESFLVAQDAFYSDTVACADVVLPAATWGETAGTTTNMERRVSRVRAAVEPPGSARQDLDIIAAIGNRIETGLFPEPPLEPGAVFAELSELTAGTKADLAGISYDRLAEELAVRWPAPDAETEGGYRYHDGRSWSFETASGQAQFSTATHSGVPEPLDADYPLVLTTGRCTGVYNTGIRSRAPDVEVANARVHPETIGKCLGAFDRGQTVIESRRDSVTVTVEADESIPPGMVWVPIHNPAANKLTLPEVDPESDEPNLKQCAVCLRAPSRPDGTTADGPSVPVDSD